jgi:hypothetical protein
MSLWKTLATIFGLDADQPAPTDVPYGTQHFSTDTGQLEGSDETQWINLVPGGTTHPHALHDLTDVDPSVAPDKGNLLIGDGTTWQHLPAGKDGQTLSTDSLEVLGVRWGGGIGGHALGPWIYDAVPVDVDDDMRLLDNVRLELPALANGGIGKIAILTDDPVTSGSITVTLMKDGAATFTTLSIDDGQCVQGDAARFYAACQRIGVRITSSNDLAPLDLNVTVLLVWDTGVVDPGSGGGTLVRETVSFEGGDLADGGTLTRESIIYEGGDLADGGTLTRESIIYEGGDLADGGTLTRETVVEP